MEIAKTRTTPYRPTSNGQVERYNQMVLSFVRWYLADKITKCDEHLAALGMSLRATVNRSTGFTPNMLMFGRENCMPQDIMFGVANVNARDQLPSVYPRELDEKLRGAFTMARSNLRTAQCRQKRECDTRSRLKERRFDVGDLVYIRNMTTRVGQSKKLLPIWKGPFVVTKAISHVLYRVADRKKERVKHPDKLRICEDRDIPLWIRRKRHQILTAEEQSVDEPSSDLQLEGTGGDTQLDGVET